MAKDLSKKELIIARKKVQSGEAVLLDVRTMWEREEEGFDPLSMHMDYEIFVEGALPDVPKDTVIYIHCKSGGRSGVIAHVLKSHGFREVYNVGGYKDWVGA